MPTGVAIRTRAVPAWAPAWLGDALGPAISVGRPVPLPVEEAALRRSRGRSRKWSVCLAVGLGLVVAGLVDRGGFVGIGAVLLVIGLAGQAWSRHRHGIQVRAKAGSPDVIVLRAHPDFDADARRIFTSSITGR